MLTFQGALGTTETSGCLRWALWPARPSRLVVTGRERQLRNRKLPVTGGCKEVVRDEISEENQERLGTAALL